MIFCSGEIQWIQVMISGVGVVVDALSKCEIIAQSCRLEHHLAYVFELRNFPSTRTHVPCIHVFIQLHCTGILENKNFQHVISDFICWLPAHSPISVLTSLSGTALHPSLKCLLYRNGNKYLHFYFLLLISY